jgi:hypothetical protein
MFVHSVYFWLKSDLSAAEIQQFEKSVRTLLEIKSMRQGWIGTPASTRRPVIDHTYSFSLTTVFDDLDGHDAYQIDPVHLKFVEENKARWTKVLIYDSE